MFFFFSKFLTLFLFPLPLFIFTGIILVFFLVSGRWKKFILLLPFLLLWLFSSNWMSRSLLLPLEEDYPPLDWSEVKEHEYVVVLGGMFHNLTRYPGRAELVSSADRITDTILLYKKGKAKKILYTGGSGALFFNQVKEADLAKIFFQNFEIPESDFFLESESRNTRENAIFTKELLEEMATLQNPKNPPPIPRFLLVTSAFHMGRSVREFEKLGLEFTPYPTDYRTLHPDTGFWENAIPSAGALDTSTMAIKEWVGRFAYAILD